MKKTYVYSEDGGNNIIVKIGETIGDVDKRIKNQNIGNWRKLNKIISTEKYSESELHTMFKGYRINCGGGKEWFEIPLEEFLEMYYELRSNDSTCICNPHRLESIGVEKQDTNEDQLQGICEKILRLMKAKKELQERIDAIELEQIKEIEKMNDLISKGCEIKNTSISSEPSEKIFDSFLRRIKDGGFDKDVMKDGQHYVLDFKSHNRGITIQKQSFIEYYWKVVGGNDSEKMFSSMLKNDRKWDTIRIRSINCWLIPPEEVNSYYVEVPKEKIESDTEENIMLKIDFLRL